jgi:hypothetical protein
MEISGKPGGAFGVVAKSTGNSILSRSYKSKNFLGAVGGLCGFTKPTARKKGFDLYFSMCSIARVADL